MTENQHMTIEEAIHKLVTLAYDQVGYKEGSNNWNKYAADPRMTELYGYSLQNQPWCAVFADYLFVDSFSLVKAKEMIFGGSPSCSVSANQYKNNGAWTNNPRKGDQIFFYVNGGINHTGIVVDVSGATITTVEGNSSDSVAKRTYYSGDASIAGYGVPNWSVVANVPGDEGSDTWLVVDGECGEMTWAALAKGMPLVKRESTGWEVTALQAMLNYHGADLDADGDYGRLTELAVKQFQEGSL